MGIVSDVGPILSFAKAYRLDLLHQVVGMLVVPIAVYEDIAVWGAGKPGSDNVEAASWITRESVND
jgi:uncharacterized protein